jgi:hypothetical protein
MWLFLSVAEKGGIVALTLLGSQSQLKEMSDSKIKLDVEAVNKLKVAELMRDIPKKLKNPKCYPEIERKLYRIMYSDHHHPTLKGFTKCKRCQAKHEKKLEAIKEFGFKSVQQYLGWKQIMDVIVNNRKIMVSSKFVK